MEKNKKISKLKTKEQDKGQDLINDIKKGLSLQLQFINQNIEKNVSPDIISQIQKYVNSHNPFDSWNEWIVYKVPVKINWSIHYFLVAKKRFDKNISIEYDNHKRLSKILDSKLDFKELVDIPKLYGQFQDATQDEAYIIMDYIQGKTLFAKLVEKVCWVSVENDKQAEKNLRDFIEQKTGFIYPEYVDLYLYLKQYIIKNQIKIFTYNDGIKFKYALKQFINHINKNGFYHRDIGNNWRNIIIWDDNKIYIIDFWQSMVTEKTWILDLAEKQEIYHFMQKGNQNLSFAHDDAILKTIEDITLMPAKKDPRELNY